MAGSTDIPASEVLLVTRPIWLDMDSRPATTFPGDSMSKRLPTTKPAQAKPDGRDRRVPSGRTAPAAVVEHDHAVIQSAVAREVFVLLARLLGRQTGRDPLEAFQAGQEEVFDTPQVDPPAEFLSVQEAADYVKVSTQTVRRWVKGGHLKFHRAGRQIRIDKSALVHFISL